MAATASGIGLIPEQAWENPDLPASPFGTPPECASIGFTNGKAAGSASPLTWSAAQFVRLAGRSAGRHGSPSGRSTPTDRYISHTQAGTTVTLTAPADRARRHRHDVTVTGTTASGATVDVDAVNIDSDGAAVDRRHDHRRRGRLRLSVAVTPPGTVVLTVTATAPNGATGFAQRTVVLDVVPGTLLFDVDRPGR